MSMLQPLTLCAFVAAASYKPCRSPDRDRDRMLGGASLPQRLMSLVLPHCALPERSPWTTLFWSL